MSAPTTEAESEPPDDSEGVAIRRMVGHAAHLLPSQAPLHAFVHHNTLHAFEHLPFEQAVLEAARLFGTEPYQTEEAFAVHLASGRIEDRDIASVLADEARPDEVPLFAGGPTPTEFKRERLRSLFEIPSAEALDWWLVEMGAGRRLHAGVTAERRASLLTHGHERFPSVAPALLESAVVGDLWERFEQAAPMTRTDDGGVRVRDRLLALTGVDTDRLVHPLLVRIAGAFLDQGVAYWSMPEREQGLLVAVRRLYGLGFAPPEPWQKTVAPALRMQEEEAWSAERTIAWALTELGALAEERPAVIERTALSLRGWAGMMAHFEVQPGNAPVKAPPARLADFLALQLVFDVFAARSVMEDAGLGSTLAELPRSPVAPAGSDRVLAYEAFVSAQLMPVDLAPFDDPRVIGKWLEQVAAFDSNERRRVLHLGYERRYRVGMLDAIQAHNALGAPAPGTPEVQALFCIDDREESLRRHLEELRPEVETLGYAGFFGVAMQYQGVSDHHARALCPPAIQARHRVVERALDETAEERERAAHRRAGRVEHALAIGSRSLARGSLLTAGVGLAAVFPLIVRCLVPGLTRRAPPVRSDAVQTSSTRLVIERDASTGVLGEASAQVGYTVSEMADIVEGALRMMGLDGRLSPLVLIVGHGSSSLNNPHEAAHDCGATGGGRGGPNARAFAMMANHAQTRAELLTRGLTIDDGTWFVAGYHNTCDDTMTYYDEDLVPSAFVGQLRKLQDALDEACVLDAHERCRRFESTSLDVKSDVALGRAWLHANDLAQPRPEYGHATNALCVVGRRQRTRGLFLDRRAFLVSYDPDRDPSGERLARLLLSVGPVGAGISLEYYFSTVDPTGYGCGTKLPHNITGLIGVMDGHGSDLRTGLPWQMVEIHEPVRLLIVVEHRREVLESILAREPALQAMVSNGWVQLATLEPDSADIFVFDRGELRQHEAETRELRVVARSVDHYRGERGHLGCARIETQDRRCA